MPLPVPLSNYDAVPVYLCPFLPSVFACACASVCSCTCSGALTRSSTAPLPPREGIRRDVVASGEGVRERQNRRSPRQIDTYGTRPHRLRRQGPSLGLTRFSLYPHLRACKCLWICLTRPQEYQRGLETIKAQGGRVIFGGRVLERDGYFVEPTIVEITHDAPIVKEVRLCAYVCLCCFCWCLRIYISRSN